MIVVRRLRKTGDVVRRSPQVARPWRGVAAAPRSAKGTGSVGVGVDLVRPGSPPAAAPRSEPRARRPAVSASENEGDGEGAVAGAFDMALMMLRRRRFSSA